MKLIVDMNQVKTTLCYWIIGWISGLILFVMILIAFVGWNILNFSGYKVWAQQKAYLKNPTIYLVIGTLGGLLIGVGTKNIGLGIALAVALGVAGYISAKNGKNDDDADAT